MTYLWKDALLISLQIELFDLDLSFKLENKERLNVDVDPRSFFDREVGLAEAEICPPSFRANPALVSECEPAHGNEL